MRIVAGTARGLRVDAPAGDDVRPTTDRVREAVFNSLQSMGVVQGAAVLDLFAGSGALGIEALSRGASVCVFVDTSSRALRAVSANLERCRLAERAEVRRGSALDALTKVEAFDLALLDPPYEFDGWAGLLALLPAQLAVIESDREIDVPQGWSVMRRRSYGTTVVTVVERVPPARHPHEDGSVPAGTSPDRPDHQ